MPANLDLLIALDNYIYYAAANGDGTYKTPVLTLQRGNFQSENIASIQVEDFDGDGLPDLFVSGAGELTSYPGNGDGTFGKAVSSVVTNASDSRYPGLALADFDGDGKLDFVASSYQSQDVAFGKGLGGGKFIATPFLYTSTMPPDSFAGNTALDANGDGKIDLVCVNLDDGTLITALTGVGGVFTYKVALPASTTTYTYPQQVYGDFNGDGKPDLVVSLTTVGTPNVYGAGVALSNGDGTFQTPVPIQLPVSLANGIQYNAIRRGRCEWRWEVGPCVHLPRRQPGLFREGNAGRIFRRAGQWRRHLSRSDLRLLLERRPTTCCSTTSTAARRRSTS